MADRLIATSPTNGYRQLGVHGQAVVNSHRQLTSILASHLSPRHAALFALPRIDPKGQRIDWYSSLDGEITPVTQLGPDAQAALRQDADQITAQIRTHCDTLIKGGGTGELVGRMLALALVSPGPDFLYRVGEQPVLAMWGHEGETVGTAPPVPHPPTAAPAVSQPEIVGTLGARPIRRGLWGWLLWLLPLLLLFLLLLLLLKACEPMAPVVVEIPDPNPPVAPGDPTADLEARLQALRDEQARLEQQKQTFLDRCVPEAPTPEHAKGLPPGPPAEPAQTPPQQPSQVTPPATPPANQDPEPPQPSALPQAQPQPAQSPPEAQSCRLPYGPGDEPEVVVIVDGSGSMKENFAGGDTRINQARRSIANMVNGLPPGVDVGLVDFRGCENVHRDKFYSDNERGQLVGEVNNLTPWGGTPLARSIERAGNIVSSDVESAIVIVSDGEESCGGDPCAAAMALKRAKPNAIVNVVDISGDAQGRAVAQCIARNTGGEVLKPNSPSDFTRKIQEATKLPDMRACTP